MMFACLAAITVVGVVFVFFTLVLIVGISMSDKTYIPKSNSILHLQLSGAIQERASDNTLYSILGEGESTIGLNDLLKAIQTAKDDDNIKGIYLEPSGLSTGYATIEELRDALTSFRETGKFVVAYGNNFTQKEYYLASTANRIILNSSGMLDLSGLTSEHIFFKNALDKLGIEMQVFKVGTYKSAVEPFIATQMSEANKMQTSRYLNSIWNSVCQGISADRDIPTDTLNAYANQMTALLDSKQYLSMGMVDDLMYRFQVESLLADLSGMSEAKKLRLVSPAEINSAGLKAGQPANIAVVYASGEIDGSSSELDENAINTEKLIQVLYDIRKDNDIKAVVLRVNSPGGSAFGSEQLWAAIQQLKGFKPVVVSMGDYAASGGYYISCNANRIFAHSATITGSIGIFGMVPNAENLLTDKLGLSFDEIKTNKYGNFPSLHRAMNGDEKMLMQKYVDRGYHLFVSRCAEGRGLSTDSIGVLAEGRVWSGVNALELGLVDEIGGMNDATEWVAEEAGLSQYSTLEYPKKKNLYEELLKQFGSNLKVQILKSFLGEDAKYYNTLRFIRNFDPVQARMETSDLK